MKELKDTLAKLLAGATKNFVREKRRAARNNDRLSYAQIKRLREKREREDVIKPAAYKYMAQAYLAASDKGTLPANARQIMYAIRPLVLAETGGKCWKKSSYFTQKLLPEYLAEHADETADWDVVYDARGHFVEPHVEKSLGIGTLDVRAYVQSWEDRDADEEIDINIDDLFPTSGPTNRYRCAAFVEKEGFDTLLARSRIAERYDLALFSSKGQSNTATRELVDELSLAGVTIFVLHDFDIYGLSIAHNLSHDGDRYTFQSDPKVIDLGLRLGDVKKEKLQSEPVEIEQKKDPTEKLWDYDDVMVEEMKFLVPPGSYDGRYWHGQRVELNAMTSRQFITFLERKLEEHGVQKVIPEQDVLAQAYRRALKIKLTRKLLEENADKLETEVEKLRPPKNLERKIAARLKKEPELPWDLALAEIVKDEKDD